MADRDIVLAYVFGSYARGEASSGSDVDVAVLGPSAMSAQELGTLAEALQTACGGTFVDVVDLATAPPLLCEQVISDGIPLLGSPEDRLEFELRTFQRVQDTAPLRRTQQHLIREASRHGRSA